ncbi:MAG: hypothetical protein ACMG6S_09500 [Byssovorax sp.]
MIHETDHDSDEPPPPQSNQGNSVDLSLSRVDHAVGKARAALASAAEARETAAEALAVSKTIEAKLGCSPDPVLGVPGRGLFGVFATLSSDVHLVASKLDTVLVSLAADRAALELAAAARKGSAARVVGWVAGPAISIAVAAFLAWLGGFHR